MRKANKRSLFCGLIGLGFIGLTSIAMADPQAEDRHYKPPPMIFLSDNDSNSAANINNNNIPSSQDDTEDDIGDGSENDSENDYDSNKEEASESAAPIPPEEEDNPVLDDNGNIMNQGRNKESQQNPMPNLPGVMAN